MEKIIRKDAKIRKGCRKNRKRCKKLEKDIKN